MCVMLLSVWMRERVESLEFCFQQCSVPEACRLLFAVVTTGKLCGKIAVVSAKLHFAANHNYR